VRVLPLAGIYERVLVSGAPEAGAQVMGTGIVSVALFLDGERILSRILLAIAIATWGALLALVASRAVRDPGRLREQARSPAALTWVAGTAVLDARVLLLGWTVVSEILLVVVLALWLLLVPRVLNHWRTPTNGGSLLLTVATQSLAVLAAAVALRVRGGWLLLAALVPFGLGLVSYLFVMARFDVRQLAVGRGDQWVTGGALAISTLAAGNITAGARGLAVLGHGSVFEHVAVGLWVASMLWLPVLVASEVVHPRPDYDPRRWGTVFPFGMYGACSAVVGAAAHAPAITSFARVWVWVALAVWALVCAAMAHSAWRGAPGRPAAG
jgi:tellurite resistance protein TehA-like permease